MGLLWRLAGSLLLGGLMGIAVELIVEGGSQPFAPNWDDVMRQQLLFDMTTLGAVVLASHVLWRR